MAPTSSSIHQLIGANSSSISLQQMAPTSSSNSLQGLAIKIPQNNLLVSSQENKETETAELLHKIAGLQEVKGVKKQGQKVVHKNVS